MFRRVLRSPLPQQFSLAVTMCLVYSPRFVLEVCCLNFRLHQLVLATHLTVSNKSSFVKWIFGFVVSFMLVFLATRVSPSARTYTKIEKLKNRYQYVQTVPKLKNRAKDLDSKTKIARLSQYEVLRTCEPPSFWESVIVGEFSSICSTSMAHAGNTKMWAKIISAYAKKCSITGFSSPRGGGGQKTQVYMPSRGMNA